MAPLQIAARFAAFAWYTSHRQAPSRIVQEEAWQFAQEHGEAFLPVVHEGLGMLLLRVTQARSMRQRRQPGKYRPTKQPPATAV